MNRGKPINNSSGFKGVHPHRAGRWKAEIGVNGQHIYIGVFDTPEDGAYIYDQWAIQLHGEFAVLNVLN